MTTDDPELDPRYPESLKKARAEYKELEAEMRASLRAHIDRATRKQRLLEKIANQLLSIEKLLRDMPSF